MLVARFTKDPFSDIEEGWSAFLNEEWGTREEGEKFYPAYEICWDSRRLKWVHFHHFGLSCWALESTCVAEAFLEAHSLESSGAIAWSGWGQRTVGRVEVIGRVGTSSGLPLWILECERCEDETYETF